jgi:phosphate transport system substrate-binding protein
MHEIKEKNRMRKLLAFVTCGALALGAAACGGDDNKDSGSSSGGSSSGSSLSGEIAGAGSSAQQAAMEAWTAKFQQANSGVTISYDPVGSGAGREQFISGGSAFAGSDAAYSTEANELTKATARCKKSGGDLVQVPDYISPIAIVYNLDGVKDLQLSPDTIAGIFAQKIKNWNDPAIKKDNPSANLPDKRIVPVNRSDESGTTENFTDYLSQTAPSVWKYDVSGTWPVKGGEAAAQTSGMIEAVTGGDGAIGYADESQAGDLGVAKVKVGSTYVKPTAEGAAKVLELSPKDKQLSKGANVFAYKLNRKTTEAGTYPLLLVSYLSGCTKYDSAGTTKIVKGFFDYIISADGQKAAADNAGSAPLSSALQAKIKPAVDAIGGS